MNKLQIEPSDREALDSILKRIASTNNIEDIRFIKITPKAIEAKVIETGATKTAGGLPGNSSPTADQYLFNCITHPAAVSDDVSAVFGGYMGQSLIFPQGTVTAVILFDNIEAMQAGIAEVYNTYNDFDGMQYQDLAGFFTAAYPETSYELYDLVFNDWTSINKTLAAQEYQEGSTSKMNVAGYAEISELGLLKYTAEQLNENTLKVTVVLSGNNEFEGK